MRTSMKAGGPLEAVVYVSSATPDLSDADLEDMLARARARNHDHAVTGALLFHEGSFLQYFEGPTQGVDVVYEHILRSPMHTGLIQLVRQVTTQRLFAGWDMGFTRARESTILQMASASWKTSLSGRGPPTVESDGLLLLRNFWERNTHGRARPSAKPSR